jgi:hypothetical protein
MPVMPDTRIPLSGGDGGSPSQSPFQTISGLMQIKEQQQRYRQQQLLTKKAQDEAEENALVGSAIASHEKLEDAADYLQQNGGGLAAMKLRNDIYDTRTKQLQAQDAELKNFAGQLELGSQMLGGATDDATYQAIRPQVAKMMQPYFGDTINDALPTVYDAGKIKSLITAGTARQNQIVQHREDIASALQAYQAGLIDRPTYMKTVDPTYRIEDHPEDKNLSVYSPNALSAQDAFRERIARGLAATNSRQEWDGVLATADRGGAPTSVVQEFRAIPYSGDYDEDALFKARDLGLSLTQREAAESRAKAAATAGQRAATADEAEDRRATAATAAAAKAAAGGASGARPLTPIQRSNEEDNLEKEVNETEKWAAEQWNNEHPTAPTPDQWNKGGYQLLSKSTQQGYIKRRVSTENKSRQRLQGLPPIEQAAKDAVRTGDQAGYDKLNKVYAGITQGLGKLEDVVKPPADWATAQKQTPVTEGRAAGPGASRATLQQTALALIQRSKDPALTPAQRLEVEQQLTRTRDALMSPGP